MTTARVRVLRWPIAAAAAALLAAGCIPLKGARPTSLVFLCKVGEVGVAQSWRVPAGVTQLTIDVLGAQGGSALDGQGGSWPGGDGGRATATIATTPGDTMHFYVGCKGGNNAGVNPGAGGAGYLPGGSGGDAAPWTGAIGGGGGGGISVVFQNVVTPILGAGSGGGAAFGAPGGAGGGASGGAGGAPPAGAPERAGRGGGSPGFGMGGDPGGFDAGGFGCACIAGAGGDHPDDPDAGGGHGGGGGGGGTSAGGGGGYGAGPGPGGGGGGTGFGPPGTVFQTGVQVGHGVIVVHLTT